MYDLLSLFWVWHMEDAKMYDLLSLFWPLPLAYWKVNLRSCCSAYWGVNPAPAFPNPTLDHLGDCNNPPP